MRHTAVDYARARQVGRLWRRELHHLFREQIDLLALPIAPHASLPLAGSEAISAAREMLKFTYPISLSGLPALSMPCGFTDDGFPIGIQLVALTESSLTQVAHIYQQTTDWHTRRPVLH
jgi:aspartyl-tRNA(Asn)/glutamyl-tRNA(Gln) amidotransferase subunit A